MAIELKRQSLLDKKKKDNNKKDASQLGKRPAQAQPEPKATAQKPRSRKAAPAAKKGRGILKKITQLFFAVLLVAAIIVPKPQLIVYKKLNLVSRSIYLPGWFGAPGKFLDSSQRVIINKPLNLIYLCFSIKQPKEQCNRYLFIEQKGMVPALNYYLDTMK